MYQFFESIKVKDGIPLHLEWHQQRVDRTFRHFYTDAVSHKLTELLIVPAAFRSGVVKARFLYDARTFELAFSHYSPREINSLSVVSAENIDYSYKYTNRDSIESLYQKREDCDDILIVKKGLVTDSSYANIVFCNGSNWVTPASPLLAGTSRQRLIDKGVITEAHIALHDIHSFRDFKLINAMLEFEEQKAVPVTNIRF